MAAWGYKFYHLVLRSISCPFASLTRERCFQHSKIKPVSQRGHVISSIFATSLEGKYQCFSILSLVDKLWASTFE